MINVHLTRKKIFLDLVGLAILALCVLTVLALFSYQSGDPSFNSRPLPNRGIDNWAGPFGSYWSDLLIQTFGLASFAMIGVLGAMAICLFLAKAPHRPILLAVGGFLLMTGSCILLDTTVESITFRGQQVLSGGVWGFWSGGLSASLIGQAGSIVLGSVLLLSGLLFVFQFTMEGLLQRVNWGAANLANIISQRWTVWRTRREKIVELRREKRAELRQARLEAKEAKLEAKRLAQTEAEPAPTDAVTPVAAEAISASRFDLGEDLREKFVAPEGVSDEPAAPVEVTIHEEPREEPVKTKKRKTSAKKSEEAEFQIEEREDLDREIQMDGSLREETKRDFQLPRLDLLNDFHIEREEIDREFLRSQARLLEEKFNDFNIGGKVTNVKPGPVITLFEFKPAPGIKVSRIANLSDDLALALSALAVRIIAPIPGRDVVGIEIPNKSRETVYFKELLASIGQQEDPTKLPIMLGKDTSGFPVMTQLTKAPHLLVAGATGAGKSVFLNALITSLLFQCRPEELRFVMIDPKMLELSIYNGVPHLLLPVITDPKKAVQALAWIVMEMERRYTVMAELEVRNLGSYNDKVRSSEVILPSMAEEEDAMPLEPMPSICVVIDEFADLMAVASKELEMLIQRISQKARAAGIHLVLATQRPSVNVITGVIKANLPTRIAFQVATRVDSRTILDCMGAEYLLGAGDMLFLDPRTHRPQRLHGAFISEEEVKRLVDFLKEQGEAQFDEDAIAAMEKAAEEESSGMGEFFDDNDDKYDEAVRIVIESGKASISYVQRRLKIGYNRAARLIETMEREGLVSGAEAGKPREVLRRDYDGSADA